MVSIVVAAHHRCREKSHSRKTQHQTREIAFGLHKSRGEMRGERDLTPKWSRLFLPKHSTTVEINQVIDLVTRLLFWLCRLWVGKGQVGRNTPFDTTGSCFDPGPLYIFCTPPKIGCSLIPNLYPTDPFQPAGIGKYWETAASEPRPRTPGRLVGVHR